MNGYAASARIERARPRVVAALAGVAAAAGTERSAVTEWGAAAPTAEPASEGLGIDVAETAVHDDLVDRFEALRERWSQLTFYLFDADGWR